MSTTLQENINGTVGRKDAPRFQLQLSRAFHNPPFPTRQEAVQYIRNIILENTPPPEGSLFAVWWGSEIDPKVILGIGTREKRAYLFDLESVVEGKVDKTNAGILVANIERQSLSENSLTLRVIHRDTTTGEETVTSLEIPAATQEEAGLLVTADKIKLDELPENAVLEERLVNIEDNIGEKTEDKYADLWTAVNTLDTGLISAEATFEEQLEEVSTAINERITAVETSLDEKITAVSEELTAESERAVAAETALETQIEAHGGRITVLEEREDADRTNIQDLDEQLAAEILERSTQYDSLERRVDGTETSITDINTHLGGEDVEISQIKNRLIVGGAFNPSTGNIELLTQGSTPLVVSLTGIGDQGTF